MVFDKTVFIDKWLFVKCRVVVCESQTGCLEVIKQGGTGRKQRGNKVQNNASHHAI